MAKRANIYPFTAIVGQDRMKRALILNAIDMRIGGVLIRGERGTGKSTAARALAVLVKLGYGGDARLAQTYHWLLDKQDKQGRWKLQNSLNGKMWIDIEKRGKPSKWVTLRALRVIKAMEDTTVAA